ncbi:MAG: hypothetical protein J6L90_05400 [Clostridia bacterium]|nr:hypothetical protein [Clostridia bacterium]
MKVIDLMKKSIAYLWAGIVLFIGLCVLILPSFIEYYCKKHFTLPNAVVFLIDLVFISATVFVAIRYGKRLERALDKFVSRGFVIVLAAALFLVQLYIARNIYFLTGWDAGMVFDSAVSMSQGGVANEQYFTSYPNNLLITFLYSFILKVNNAVGILPENEGVFAIIAFQCMLFAVCAYLVYSVCYELTKRKTVSLLAFAVFFLLIGLSPWVVIPYSDSTGIIFPILIFRIYQLSARARGRVRPAVLWGVNALVSYIGFKIKPQLVIMFIAVVIVEVFRTAFLRRKDLKLLKKGLTNIVACVLVLVIAAAAFSVFCSTQTSIKLDEEREMGAAHIFMMGMNGKTYGGYLDSDILFSMSFDTKAERDRENMRVAFERIQEMGFFGLVNHTVRKSLANFGDGSFAWGVEGRFYDEVLPEPNASVAPWLRSLYYNDGDNYRLFEDSMQAIWLAVLIFSGTAVLYIKRNKGKNGLEASLLVLSLIGLALFEALFEARARYLMTYAPIFIICAVIGLYTLTRFIREKFVKCSEE